MKLEATRFVMSPGGSALGLPVGEYWAVPDAELRAVQGALEKSKADARALWAVRVLDAWAANKSRAEIDGDEVRYWSNSQSEELAYCSTEGGMVTRLIRSQETPDAARLAAATALYPDLPESVRRELGECP